MNIDTIFIECLKLPVFARVEYLEAEQAKSNFSKEIYIKILYDKWKEYKGIVFKSDLEKPFDDLVREKGWEYAAITVYGDEPEPFEHIYSNTEYDEIETENLFNNLNQNNFEWLTENVLWVLLDYIYRLYDKWETTLIAKPLPPQQIETKTEQETPTFQNNFDMIKPTEIYIHFKAGLVEKGYLTEQELKEYLKAAFELKTIPETLFKIKDAPKKKAIEAVFYKYYKNVAGKIHGKQNQYAALLGDYFEGYKTTTVSSNFSKSIY